jgi:cell division protein FtsB
VCLCLTTYFAYHAIQGRHGLEARTKLISRSAQLEQEIKVLEAVRARLDHETALLNESTPDPDYVDELARQMLGYARPGDRLLLDLAPGRSKAL